MKVERTHENSYNHRSLKKKQANNRVHDKQRQSLIKICITFGIFTVLIGKVELDNISLYKQGQTTKAYVFHHTSKSRRGVSLYEFKVNGIRYTGHDKNSEVGNFIDIVYLPNNPKINRNAKVIDQDWCVWLYRKITE